MWYRFEEGNPIGVPRIKEYQVAFYDMTVDGSCFDESFFPPNEIDRVIPFVETDEDVANDDRTRVFVYFDDGEMYELKLERISKERKHRCNKFYD